MFNDPEKRCGTKTTMTTPESLFTLTVSIVEDLKLQIDIDASEDIHAEDIIELLMETIESLEQS